MTLLQPELRVATEFDSIQGERLDVASINTCEILGGVVRLATSPHRKKLSSRFLDLLTSGLKTGSSIGRQRTPESVRAQ